MDRVYQAYTSIRVNISKHTNSSLQLPEEVQRVWMKICNVSQNIHYLIYNLQSITSTGWVIIHINLISKHISCTFTILSPPSFTNYSCNVNVAAGRFWRCLAWMSASTHYLRLYTLVNVTGCFLSHKNATESDICACLVSVDRYDLSLFRNTKQISVSLKTEEL